MRENAASVFCGQDEHIFDKTVSCVFAQMPFLNVVAPAHKAGCTFTTNFRMERHQSGTFRYTVVRNVLEGSEWGITS